MVELGQEDICLECSMMSSHLYMPRQGNLLQVQHMFAYLKKNHNTEMVYGLSDQSIDEATFKRKDWNSIEFRHIQGEELPGNMPQLCCLGLFMRSKVDADHAVDTVTRIPRTSFLLYLNSVPIYWSTKKQDSVEYGSFGSELITTKQ